MSFSQPRGLPIEEIPKTWNFTEKLPSDVYFPTPADSHNTPRDQIRPRIVNHALYTWVRPEPTRDPELLSVSPAAMLDLGIRADDHVVNPLFLKTVSGNAVHGWDSELVQQNSANPTGYPWSQCYGGFQFGSWAGQLGDGRVVSLFETANQATKTRYEVQLKGAGMTPYSRFADGKAVLRSSIREFLVSEALHWLGVPSTRALAIVLLPHERVFRERVEPGAIVTRFAQSWLRCGTFDLLRARGDRLLTRKLADYVAQDVFPGWESLPGRWRQATHPAGEVRRGVNKFETEVEDEEEEEKTFRDGRRQDSTENRYARVYREIVRRNAHTVARWQAFGFMNGVLNTDNTSIFGLSMDFGPFAFMDTYDPEYTPNHDDTSERYSYKHQPTAVWWNLVRLGEALGELMGAGSKVDEAIYSDDKVKDGLEAGVASRAEKIILRAGDEFKAVFATEYKQLMMSKLGFQTLRDDDREGLFSMLLDMLEALELDFHHFFRRLSNLTLHEVDTDEKRMDKAAVFLHKEGPPDELDEIETRTRIASFLKQWHDRLVDEHSEDDQRVKQMKKVNPNFIPRSWVLDEIVKRVEKQGEREVLHRAVRMVTYPYEDSWDGVKMSSETEPWKGDKEEETRWIGDVPREKRAMQCSCSS